MSKRLGQSPLFHLFVQTAFGKKAVVRRFGVSGEYVETIPTPSAPHGEFWTLNPQRGWVPVPSNGRALRAAIAAAVQA